MSMMDALQQRRTYYNINKELPVSIEEVRSLVDQLTELVPDAFNMKSSRIVHCFRQSAGCSLGRHL